MACPTPDELLGLSEGSLDPTRAAELRAHVPGCERCAKIVSRIEQLRGMVSANAARAARRRRALVVSTVAAVVLGTALWFTLRAVLAVN